MSVSAADGDAERFPGEHVRSALASTEVSSAAGAETPVRTLGAAVSKLHHRASGGVADSGGLGGDEGLEIHDVQHSGLYELRVKDGALDAEEWLVGEDGTAFRDGIDIEIQSKIREVLEKFFLKQRCVAPGAEGGKVIEISGFKFKFLEPLYGGGESGGDCVAAFKRGAAEEEMEHAFTFMDVAVEIGGGHGELVEIGLEWGGHNEVASAE